MYPSNWPKTVLVANQAPNGHDVLLSMNGLCLLYHLAMRGLRVMHTKTATDFSGLFDFIIPFPPTANPTAGGVL